MSHSFPQNRTSVITFRCTTEQKEQMQIFADVHHLSLSDVIRQAMERFMSSGAAELLACCEPVSEEKHEALLSVIDRAEPPLQRDAILHHHIAFLNRDEHNYKGFRFRISRQKNILQRYFSANNYGSEGAAFAAALTVRDYVEEQLMLRPDEYMNIYEESWKVAPRIQQARR